MNIIEEIDKADVEQCDSVPHLRRWVRALAERVEAIERELAQERQWQLEQAEY